MVEYKNTDFVAWLKSTQRKNTVYMWGAFGNRITEKLILSKKKQYPARYPESRIAILKDYIGQAYGCDCCGLIKWYLMTDGGRLASPTYSAKYDKTASGWYFAAREKGKISTLPEMAGMGVYKKGHIGIYIGNGKVIECTLSVRGDGVVISDLKAEKWTHWLKIPYISYAKALAPDKLIKKPLKVKTEGRGRLALK